MSIFKKLFGEEAPKWAQPISKGLYKEFQDDVTTFLSSTGLIHEYFWETGKVRLNLGKDLDENSHLELNFSNLLQNWKDSPALERKVLTNEFIQRMVDGYNQEVLPLSQCLSQLLVRVYDEDYAKEFPCFVVKQIGNYLKAGLVLDMGSVVKSVLPESVFESELDQDQLLAQATINLIEQILPIADVRHIEANHPMRGHLGNLTLITAEIYGASCLLILDKFTQPGQTYWVSVPARDLTMVFEPLSSTDEDLANFLQIAGNLSKGSPNHYIAPVILEYKDGIFRDLCSYQNGVVHILDQPF